MTVRYSKQLSPLLVLALFFCVVTTAYAEPHAPVEPELSDLPLSFAVLGSYGFSSDYTRGGLGLRGGLHLGARTGLYLGGTATYFFGQKSSRDNALGTGSSSTQRNFMYLGAEAGIDLPVIEDVTVRPYFGLGLGRSAEKTCSGDDACDTNASYPVTITPGVLGLYYLGGGVFVGADIRFLIAAGEAEASDLILSGTIGYAF